MSSFRTALWAALGGAMLAGAAHAQDAQDNSGSDDNGAAEQQDTSGETEAKDVKEHPTEVKTQPGGKDTAPGEVHTVVKGDTLWDLSQHYLGSPWYWPKVWSYNPEIANPHWIYPGNKVRFFAMGEEAPTQVEAGEELSNGNEEPSEDSVDPSSMLNGEEPGIQVSSKIGYTPPNSRRWVHHGFATDREVQEAGVIQASFAETEMLSFPDTAYIEFRQSGSARVGERYTIFRTSAELEHPRTGSRLGYLTDIIGTVKILRVDKNIVTGQIMPDCWDEVHRGDFIGPSAEKLTENISERPNDRELKGFIVSAQIPYLAILGEHNVVVIDRGSADGVQQGNTFIVVRRHDPLRSVEAFISPSRAEDLSLPKEDIGKCMAVDVKERLTLCLLTKSLKDLERGDKVEMRASGGAAPTASR